MRRHLVASLSPLAIFVALMLAIISLAACGVSSSDIHAAPTTATAHASTTATPLPLPTSLTVLRYSPEDNRAAPFQQTTSDTAKIQQLYHTLDALPYKAPSSSCPLYAYGTGYELSFMQGDTLVLQVMLQTCYGVSISNSKSCRQWTPALTSQLAATFGVPSSALEPKNVINTAGPNGPFAQPAPTPPILLRCF